MRSSRYAKNSVIPRKNLISELAGFGVMAEHASTALIESTAYGYAVIPDANNNVGFPIMVVPVDSEAAEFFVQVCNKDDFKNGRQRSLVGRIDYPCRRGAVKISTTYDDLDMFIADVTSNDYAAKVFVYRPEAKVPLPACLSVIDPVAYDVTVLDLPKTAWEGKLT